MIFKRRYMGWNEYSHLVEQRDWVLFVHNTAKSSLKNIIRKEAMRPLPISFETVGLENDRI